MAICVSLSFGLAAPFSLRSEAIYQRCKPWWDRFQSKRVHPRDQVIDTADARVLVIGMGRVGTGAYDDLAPRFEHQVLGIEHDAERVDVLRESGRKVLQGDATDTDFWNKLKAGRHIEMIVLAMPSHGSNVYAARQIRALGVQCTVVAIAKFPEEVAELEELHVPAFNMYSEAGSGLARQAVLAHGGRWD
jgi:Trk K+ transport system NAD-binding subunit